MSVLGDIGTTSNLLAGGNVVALEESVVHVATMTQSKMETGDVLGDQMSSTFIVGINWRTLSFGACHNSVLMRTVKLHFVIYFFVSNNSTP